MNKTFNTDGYCDPELHYMVNLSGRLEQIKEMVDAGKYFTINRARQYGKTTTLTALADYLKKDYEVISLDFQTLSSLSFESEQEFTAAFAAELLDVISEFPDGISQKLEEFAEKNTRTSSLQALFKVLKAWCMGSKRKLVLMIDEADTAANNQVFLDFLAQLRAYYLQRRRAATFQSVILAGVYDVRSIRRKLRPDEAHQKSVLQGESDYVVMRLELDDEIPRYIFDLYDLCKREVDIQDGRDFQFLLFKLRKH